MTYKSLLSCSCNTRELGGIRTAEGRITKCGVFWRSDVLSEPDGDDLQKLLAERITTVIDMRTEEEALRKPCGLADKAEFDYHHFPITEGSGVPESLEAVPLSYMDIATAESMPKVMKTIAEAAKGVIFHCTAGKDRTGVVAAIILMLCGADRKDIVDNYVISREYNKERLRAFLEAHPEVDRNIVLANEKSMNGFIDLFTRRFGSVENYFTELGLSREHAEMIRRKLLVSEQFSEKLQQFFEDFGKGRKMVLSTSENDIVSSRMMSVVQFGGAFYFQTDKELRKYHQLSVNGNGALCIDNIQIEGICEELGRPIENKDFCSVFSECFKGSFDAYTALKNERLFVLRPLYIQRWLYIDGVPYIESFDIKAGEYSCKEYKGI